MGKLRERSSTPVDPSEALRVLRGLPALAGLDEATLGELARTAKRFEVGPGVDVISQGRFPSGLFVLVSGSVDIFVSDVWGEEPTKVNTLGPGAHFGEIGLIEGMPSTATVRTVEPSGLIRFDGREFLDLVAETPGALLAFMGEMAGAMARTDPRYRFAVDERTRGAEDVDLETLKELAALAGELGPGLEPFGDREVLNDIAAVARDLFGAAACSIAVADGGELVYRGAAGEGADEVRGLRLPVDRGVAGSVFRTGETVAVADVSADPRFDRAFAGSTGYVPGSLHAVRLDTPVGPVGVLQVLDAARALDRDGLKQLELFAGLAALVIRTGTVFTDLGGALFDAARRAVEGASISGALEAVARERRSRSSQMAEIMVLVRQLQSLPEGARRDALGRMRTVLKEREPKRS